ncbi:methyltransferase family protein [Subtercola sp. YIM 133946]|uniref:methyltransferase family protein n=1 Tax=Subtercola sp. YIM 133946 TaxID=3118909 RepID=UPI002F91ECFB
MTTVESASVHPYATDATGSTGARGAAATPARILDIAVGYMASKQLFEASRIGLFASLQNGALTIDAIAAATGVSVRIARILADAMSSLGLIARTDGQYSLAADAADYLVGGDSSVDLAPFLTFLSEISYPHWLQFGHTVDTSEPGDLGMTDERWATFLAGVMTYNRLHSQMFTRFFDVTPYRNSLDYGGLAAYFSLEAMSVNPDLHTTFMFAPDFAESVTAAIQDAALTDRATVLPVDTATGTPVGSYDLVLANHVIHRFDAEQNARIFGALRDAALPGARLVVLDFFLDDDEHQRRIDALHAGEYLVIDGTVVYPEAQVRGWLSDARWNPIDVIELPGSPRLLVAEAV